MSTATTGTIMETNRDGEAKPLFVDPFFLALKDVRDSYAADRRATANTEIRRLVASANYRAEYIPGVTVEYADFWVEGGMNSTATLTNPAPIFPRVIGPVDALGWPLDPNEPLDMSDPFEGPEADIAAQEQALFNRDIALGEQRDREQMERESTEFRDLEEYRAWCNDVDAERHESKTARPRPRRRSSSDSTSTACRESEGIEA